MAAKDPIVLHPALPVSAGTGNAGGTNIADPTVSEIVVHVTGAVRKPGVYHLPPTARNDDALKAAGGPTSDANTAAINLAARAQDGAQVYIPTHKEQPNGGASPDFPSPTIGTSSSKVAHASIAHPGDTKSATGGKPAKLTNPAQGRININMAGTDDLQRIPGIGPAMAERLIAYRKENHGFQSVEDLMQVSGIGAKKFERMQPFIRVK